MCNGNATITICLKSIIDIPKELRARRKDLGLQVHHPQLKKKFLFQRNIKISIRQRIVLRKESRM